MMLNNSVNNVCKNLSPILKPDIVVNYLNIVILYMTVNYCIYKDYNLYTYINAYKTCQDNKLLFYKMQYDLIYHDDAVLNQVVVKWATHLTTTRLAVRF